MEYTIQKCKDVGSFKENLTNYLLLDGEGCHLKGQIHKNWVKARFCRSVSKS